MGMEQGGGQGSSMGAGSGSPTGGTTQGNGFSGQRNMSDGSAGQGYESQEASDRYIVDGVDLTDILDKVDLDKFPGFREHKSKFDTRINEYGNRIGRLGEENQYLQNQLRGLQQQLEAKNLEGKDEFEVMEIRVKQLIDENTALRNDLIARRNQESRNEFVRAVKDEFGIDLSDKNFKSPDEAMLIVARLQREQKAGFEKELETYKKRGAAEDAAGREAPDLGGGTPVGANALQRQFDDAMSKRNGSMADRISRQAAEEGVELDRYAWTKGLNLRKEYS